MIRPFAIIFAIVSVPTCGHGVPWQEEIGFARLQSLAPGQLPTAAYTLSHVEAPDGSANYKPDTTNSAFAGKTFTAMSGSSGVSSHATHVGVNFYGSASQLPGPATIRSFEANSWIGSGFLHLGDSSLPDVETGSVQSHSWIGNTSSALEINQRLDYAIDRDGFVCVVGENNGASTVLPQLLGQAYHVIAVGRDDGQHSAGLTTLDGTGRMKPDIVAPSSSPENATSWTTPMVAGTAALLHAKLGALTNSEKPRVVKALLLASARKDTLPQWSHTAVKPLDPVYGAGEVNAWHAYHSLLGGRQSPSTSPRLAAAWGSETIPANATHTYRVRIPAGPVAVPFCAALTWHRNVTTQSRPFRTWSTSMANLNLELQRVADNVVMETSASAADNVELVNQAALAPGDYDLRVINTSAFPAGYALAWHGMPVVGAVTGFASAAEFGPVGATITISRKGDTSMPMLVPLAIGGTAVPGVHYVALPASITIPTGSSSVVLTITPIPDNIAQGQRSVTVAPAGDFTYARDTTAAVATIADKPLDAWRFANFSTAELANPVISGEHADPDGDTLPNLLEYAFDLPPKQPAASPIAPTTAGGALAIAVAKNPDATDLIWSAWVSGNLIHWDPAMILTNDAVIFEARDTMLMSQSPGRFIRVQVRRQ